MQYCKSGQKSMAKENIDPKQESSIAVMLNGHDMKPSSKCICLFPQIGEALSLGLRSFYLKAVAFNTNLNWSICQE